MIQCSMFLHKMADYTLRYSGADIDSICDKVTDMRFTAAEISNFFEKKDKLRMVWRKHVLEGEIEAGITRYSTVTFPDVFPAGLENRDDLFIIAGSDYGNMDCNNAGVYYKKEGRNVICTVKYGFDSATSYKITVYCLVVFTADGGQSIE